MQERVWDRLYALGLLAAGVVVLLTFPDYGITWDEPLHVEYGQRTLNWYLSLGADRSFLDFQNLYLYGALHDTLVALLSRVLPLDGFDTSHLAGGLLGLLGAIGCHRLATEFASKRAGFLAAMLLLATPDWWQHSFNNPKDIPFAVAAIWSLVFLTRAARELPAPSWKSALGYGATLGAALGVRVAAAVTLGALAAVGLAWAGRRVRQGGSWEAWNTDAARILTRLLPALGLAYVIMVLSWPWALLDPLRHPAQASQEFARFPFDIHFTFAGQVLDSTQLPWWYLPVGFGVKLPELFLLALLGAAILALMRLTQGRIRLDAVALGAAILVPPTAIIAVDSVLYDGIRHTLFLVPPMAAAGGIALDHLAGRLTPSLQRLAAVVLVLYATAHGWTMARLHPYEGIYYNQLAGGTRNAAGKFELDYWGSAMSEAARDLTQQLIAKEGPGVLARSFRIRVCGPPTSALYYLPPRWRGLPTGTGEADFYIAYTRAPCGSQPGGREILRVEREGQALAFVRDLRPAPVAAAAPATVTAVALPH